MKQYNLTDCVCKTAPHEGQGFTYDEALTYLSNLNVFEIRLRLDTTLQLLDFLGDPHKKYNAIHVAGTNGKGSVCAMLNSILAHSGFVAGMYISPPMTDFTERIRIRGELIEEGDVTRLTEMLSPKVDEMIKNKNPPTFFEVVTAIAFKYFQEKDVDIAVMEVGLGGRLDATNVIKPLVSVITNVQRDHMWILGKNIGDIANEKAGIIKDSTPVVTAETDESALKVINEACKKKKAPLTVVGKDVKFKNLNGQVFDYHGVKGYRNIELNLLGDFQIRNAATALATLECSGLHCPESAIRSGLKDAKWPGRMELLKNVLLDCAHNPSGARELAKTINEIFKKNAIFVIGMSAGKDIYGMLNELFPISSEFVITKSAHPNAEKTERIVTEVKKITSNYVVREKVPDALSYALSKKGMVCVTGSIFVVGEARRMLKNEI